MLTNLSPGGTKRIGFALSVFNLSDGDEIKSLADYQNVVNEKNETNNSLSIVFRATPAPTPTPTPTVTATPTPTLTPKLVVNGTESYSANGKQWVRYKLVVENWAEFPAELFSPAPDLPPCGLNKNSSRTWVNIYNASNGGYIYGFCALSSPKSMTSIWFAIAQGSSPPAGVYVVLNDRRMNKKYTSNVAST